MQNLGLGPKAVPSSSLFFAHFNNDIPFVLPQVITDGTHMGRGILRYVTFAIKDTDVSIVHNLGRIPRMVLPLWVIDDGKNPPTHQVYTPKLRPSTATAWTTTTVAIQADTVCTSLLLWIV